MNDDTTHESSIKLCECGCGNPAPIAAQSTTRLGHVKGQPVRFIRGHHNKVRALRPIADRFWEKVNKRGPDDCWLWTGSQDSHGYGQLQTGTQANPHPSKAPRVSYELHHGPIPADLLVCHNCPDGDNPLCVNPAHLFLGTHTDNLLDAYAKGRTLPPGHGKHSEDHPSAHFTNDQVRAWRKEFADANVTMTTFAASHGIPRNTMVSILKRENYIHV